MLSFEKKQVIWTICSLYPPNFGGRGIQAHKEHCQFVQLGQQVNVLTRGIAAAKRHRGKQIIIDGVQVRYFPVVSLPDMPTGSKFPLLNRITFSILDNLSSLSFAIMASWVLWLHATRGDIVRFEAYNRYAIFPLLVTRLKGLHSIARMSLLGSDDPYAVLQKARKGQFLEYLIFHFYRMSDVIVAICSAMIESCQQSNFDADKIVYIPHGVDTELYKPVDEGEKRRLRKGLGLDPYKRYIILVGSAVYRKGIDVVIDAFIQLRSRMQDVELLIVGPHSFENRGRFDYDGLNTTVQDCKRKLDEENYASSVHWVGKVSNVNDYMKAADIFCLPTRREGFGIVIIEAMASGLPVVVSRLAGVTTDIVSSESEGILIEGHNPKDYAEAMLELFDQPQKLKQMALASREHAVSRFSMREALMTWMRLFDDVNAGKYS